MDMKEESPAVNKSAQAQKSKWQDDLKVMYHRGLELYQAGERDPNQIVSATDATFLASVGMKPQELYDFVEDWAEDGAPSSETMLAITEVRREYFLGQQGGTPSSHVVSSDSLPPRGAELGGIRWLPRIIMKARAKLNGELPPTIMYDCGGDRAFLREVGLHPADFLRIVWKAGEDDRDILEQVQRSAGKV